MALKKTHCSNPSHRTVSSTEVRKIVIQKRSRTGETALLERLESRLFRSLFIFVAWLEDWRVSTHWRRVFLNLSIRNDETDAV